MAGNVVMGRASFARQLDLHSLDRAREIAKGPESTDVLCARRDRLRAMLTVLVLFGTFVHFGSEGGRELLQMRWGGLFIILPACVVALPTLLFISNKTRSTQEEANLLDQAVLVRERGVEVVSSLTK